MLWCSWELDRTALDGDVRKYQESLLDGLKFLSDRDGDRAAYLNDMGFNRADGDFAESLMTSIEHRRPLLPGAYRSMGRMLKKYQKTQLMAAGIIIPTQEQVEQLVQALHDQRRKREQEMDTVLRQDPLDAPDRYNIDLARNVQGYGSKVFAQQLRLVFPYDEAKLAQLKEGPYREYFEQSAGFRGKKVDPNGPCWYIAVEALEAIRALFPDWSVSPEVLLLNTQPALPRPVQPQGKPRLTDCPF